MTENLKRALETLCEELGLQAPSADDPIVEVDGHELRVVELSGGKAVLLGRLGSISSIAEERRESVDTLLMRSLTLHGARFAKLGTPEALTLDEDTMVLWNKFDSDAISVQDFLRSSESMLNEVEFWKNWLAVS
jgi:hypothetical protein